MPRFVKESFIDLTVAGKRLGMVMSVFSTSLTPYAVLRNQCFVASVQAFIIFSRATLLRQTMSAIPWL